MDWIAIIIVGICIDYGLSNIRKELSNIAKGIMYKSNEGDADE